MRGLVGLIAACALAGAPAAAMAQTAPDTRLGADEIDAVAEAATVECPVAFAKASGATTYIQGYAELRKWSNTETKLFISLCRIYAKGMLDGVERPKSKR
jgi:opacity protein-like surface antigen